MTTMTLLHPGVMGATIGAEAVRGGVRVLWVPEGRSHATAERARAAGLREATDLDDALAHSDIVLSVCPTHAAEEVARQVAARPFTGIYVEANPISPQRLRRIDALLGVRCTVLDGSVFGPTIAKDRVACLYLSGPEAPANQVAAPFSGSAVHTRILPGTLGAASALKMAFINYQRSARVLSALSHALADSYGLTDELLVEAGEMANDHLTNPGYLTSVAARAWRWEPELHEVGDTLRDAGLPDELAEATARVLDRWKGDKDRRDIAVAEVLGRLRED